MFNHSELAFGKVNRDRINKEDLYEIINSIRNSYGRLHTKDEIMARSLRLLEPKHLVATTNKNGKGTVKYKAEHEEQDINITVSLTSDNKIVKTYTQQGSHCNYKFIDVTLIEDKNTGSLLKASTANLPDECMLENFEKDFAFFGVTKEQLEGAKKYCIYSEEIAKLGFKFIKGYAATELVGNKDTEVYVKDVGTLIKTFERSGGTQYLRQILFIKSDGKERNTEMYHENGVVSIRGSKTKVTDLEPFVYQEISEYFDKQGILTRTVEEFEKDKVIFQSRIINYNKGKKTETIEEVIDTESIERKLIKTTKKYIDEEVNETIVETIKCSPNPYDSTIFFENSYYNNKNELTKIVHEKYKNGVSDKLEEIYENGKHIKNIISNENSKRVEYVDEDGKLLNKVLVSKAYKDEYISKYEEKFTNGIREVIITLKDGTVIKKVVE